MSIATTRAVVLSRLGGPEVLEWREWPLPPVGDGEVEIEVSVAGVNFMDVGTRTMGNLGAPPLVPGVEGAGRVVTAPIGSRFTVGDRVAWYFAPGSYAERLVMPEDSLVPVPEEIDDELAASIMMQGLSAYHFLQAVRPTAAGDVAVIYAAAGGVGLLLTQFLKARGAVVLAVVGSEEKVATCTAAGADHVIVTRGEGLLGQIQSLVGQYRVDVVYGSRSQVEFDTALAVLNRHGVVAYLGRTDEWTGRLTLDELRRSTSVIYPVVMDFVPTASELRARSAELFEMVISGALRPTIGGRYPLAEAARAHRDLASRNTVGKLLLLAGSAG